MTDQTQLPPTVLVGCFDASCIWRRPSGMTTNGGCNCEKDLRQALRDIGYTPSQSIAFTSAVRSVRNAIESEAK